MTTEPTEVEAQVDKWPVVTIFTAYYCPFCLRAKTLLSEQKIPFTEIQADNYAEIPLRLRRLTSKFTVPQIFFHNMHIGGCDDLTQLVKTDKLFETLEGIDTSADLVDDLRPPSIDLTSVVADGKKDWIHITAALQLPEHQIIGAMRESLPRGSIPYRIIFSHSNAFTGQGLVNWLCSHYELPTQDDGMALALRLVETQIITLVDPNKKFTPTTSTICKLYCETQPVGVLNNWSVWKGDSRGPLEVSTYLRQRYLSLLTEFTVDSGVQYVKLQENAKFVEFSVACSELQAVDLSKLNTKEDKITFFLNTYNLLVLHGFGRLGPPSTNLQRGKFFSSTSYNIGGMVFSLNDIEHGVLRGNKPPPYTWFKPFGASDKRLPLALDECEKRIHFALNCGASSCPVVRMYAPDSLNDLLDYSTVAFFEHGVTMKTGSNTVELSMLFKWYSSDFGKSDKVVLQYIAGYIPDHRKELKQLLTSGNAKIKYMTYDWTTNMAKM
eukprot:TRINITY_DN66228_c9_g1_i1.p1 TRINITY_DN66228_c9_g1~~TRINITY_DN66228_c9_g1_i1.p1  ORF type:complete len:495 (+),score=36.18 TRINITY_DN66228_c9_g1_i1:21-1505(+)